MATLLQRLAVFDADAWEQVFPAVYPAAAESAKLRMGGALHEDWADVAMETLARLSDKIGELKSEDELKPLAVAIARNIAADKIRKHLAEKRGGDKTQSLDALTEAGAEGLAAAAQADILEALSEKELGEILAELSSQIRKEYRVVLRDRFFEGLSYAEIARRHGIAVNSVGVYIQRGLAALKTALSRKPDIERELLNLLGDSGAARLLLPLISAVELGAWLHGTFAFATAPRNRFGETMLERELNEEDRLRLAYEKTIPSAVLLDESRTVQLVAYVCRNSPGQFGGWLRDRQKRRALLGQRRTHEPRERRQHAGKQPVVLAAVALVILVVLMYLVWR